MSRYHVVVIGSGPGGYVAAIRAAQLGFQTAIIERESLGGICLNWGCIPTKALLTSAHLLEHMKHAVDFGIKSAAPEADFKAVIARSRQVAADMAKGIEYLMNKNKITVIRGTATFLDRFKVKVENQGQTQEVESDRFIVATGARARALPGVPIDGEYVMGYRQAMSITERPSTLCILGAGAIGVEFADFYASMGTRVTLLEAMDHILPQEDDEIAAVVLRSFQKRGMDVQAKVRVSGAEIVAADFPSKKGVRVTWQTSDGKTEAVTFERMLSAAGVAANTDNLGLETIGVRLQRDRIVVDDHYRTNVESIYAIGDCIPTASLAHVASMEGIKAAEGMKFTRASHHEHFLPINYDWIPSCTYCHPEVASIGKTEKKLKEEGITYKKGIFPFRASGRARATGEMDGMVKVLAGGEYNQILGVHIVGEGATEIISGPMLGAANELTVENFARTMHAHPTFSEGVMEAMAAVLGEAVNI
ncbi:MAG: dihydrolipoyl dehydrogenase [Leptospirales bacterium]|nr:dihydrolipoyl dehydrogenase [Leptospirales bacterium]